MKLTPWVTQKQKEQKLFEFFHGLLEIGQKAVNLALLLMGAKLFYMLNKLWKDWVVFEYSYLYQDSNHMTTLTQGAHKLSAVL